MRPLPHFLLSALVFIPLQLGAFPKTAEKTPGGPMPLETKPSTMDEYSEADSIDPKAKSRRVNSRPGAIRGGPLPTDTNGVAGGASGEPRRPENHSPPDEK